MARPVKEVDVTKIEGLASRFCSNAEIGAAVGLSESTIEKRYNGIVKRGKERARGVLRSTQFQVAIGRPGEPTEYLKDKHGEIVFNQKTGKPIVIKSEVKALAPNVAMLIWLGKNYLNQSEKFMIGQEDGLGFGFTE